MAAGQLADVILLCGQEQFLVDWAEKAIREKFTDPVTAAFNFTLFRDDAPDADEIIAACETLPMMAEKKLVEVKGADESVLDSLAGYLPDLPDSTELLFVLDKVDKRKTFYKSLVSVGIAYDFTYLDESTLASWVNKRLTASGKSASRNDIIRFAYEVGYFDKDRDYGLFNLDNDLKKACCLYDQSVLSYDDLIWIASGEDEIASFKLLDAAFSKRKGEAFKLLHNNIKQQQPSKQMGVIISTLGLLCSQLEIMLEAREREKDGQSFSQIQKEMGTNSYRLQKAIDTARPLTTKRLKAALSAAYNIEKDMKEGKMDGQLALELFLSKL